MSEFTDSFHQLTAFVIPQLAALSQLKYGANNDPTQSLFSTHPTSMLLAISSFMLYYVLHVVLLRSPMTRFSAVVQLLLVWSAYATASALTAALFPAWASTPLYVIFVLPSTGEFIGFFGNKFVTEDEDKDKDKDKDEDEEGETCNFRRVRRLCSRVATLFGPQPQPILPIRIQHWKKLEIIVKLMPCI